MKAALNYNETLKERFEDFPQIKRIAKYRHVPVRIFKEQKTIKKQLKSRARK